MTKWNSAVRVSEEQMLRGWIPVNENFAEDQSVDSVDPTYAFIKGWHFYAYLDIPLCREQSDKASDEVLISKLFHYYSRAAKRICAVFGDASELLEHQGSLLHFHLKLEPTDIARVRAFGHLLATFVHDDVMPSGARTQLRFSMAAEWGVCCIVRVPSASGEGAAYSRVSLGPCANNPAKLLLGGGGLCSWALAYRNSDKVKWTVESCDADDVSRRLISEARSKTAHVPGAKIVNEAFAEDSLEIVPDTTYSTAEHTPGYVFRADLDGFTGKVQKAFADGREQDAERLAVSFIKLMEEVAAWQAGKPGNDGIITCPWAGDCCTMIVCPRNAAGEPDMVEAKKRLSSFPAKLIMQWEQGVAQKHLADGLGSWAYSVALGQTRIFTETVDGTAYRLIVGWPVGVTQTGVNVDAAKPGDLVMHSDDVQDMTAEAKSSFEPVIGDFRRQTAGDRKELLNKLIAGAGAFAQSRTFQSYSVPVSRPYFPLRKDMN